MTDGKENPVGDNKICKEHTGLVANIDAIKNILEDQGLLVQKLFSKIDELKEKLFKRPSWAVTLYLTICTTLVGIMTTAFIGLLLKMKDNS